jgi:hypothetical protein
MKDVSELSLADLLALYNHYATCASKPASDQQAVANNMSWSLITRSQFAEIEAELNIRLKGINFINK